MVSHANMAGITVLPNAKFKIKYNKIQGLCMNLNNPKSDAFICWTFYTLSHFSVFDMSPGYIVLYKYKSERCCTFITNL